MTDLKSAAQNALDRIRGKRPVSQPVPTETVEPAAPAEKVPSAEDVTTPIDKESDGAGAREDPPAATGN